MLFPASCFLQNSDMLHFTLSDFLIGFGWWKMEECERENNNESPKRERSPTSQNPKSCSVATSAVINPRVASILHI